MKVLNNFWNKESVLEDNTWDIFKNKSWLWKSWKIISLFKQEADAILNKEQVLDWYYYSKKEWVVKLDKYLVREKASEYADTQGFLDEKDWKIFWNQRVLFISQQVANNNSFSYISEKFKMINKNIDNILFWIANNWFISKSSVYFSLLHVYLNNYYISINDIEKRLFNYFEKIANKAYNRAKSPLIASYDYWYKEVVQEYHDLEHDLWEEEKQILVYCMVNNLLWEEKKHELEKILKKWWDSLDYFYNSYYDEDLFVKYLNRLIKN
jgi:hypothetical protein